MRIGASKTVKRLNLPWAHGHQKAHPETMLQGQRKIFLMAVPKLQSQAFELLLNHLIGLSGQHATHKQSQFTRLIKPAFQKILLHFSLEKALYRPARLPGEIMTEQQLESVTG